MTLAVIDSSVAVKWYVPEIHSLPASRFLDETYELHAPDLLWAEFGNVLWKKAGRGELTHREVNSIARAITTVPLQIHSSHNLLEAAVEIALDQSRTVYDSLYLALAVGLDCPFVTADDRLFNALQDSALASHVQHVNSSRDRRIR